MVRLTDLDPSYARHLRELPLPAFETTPWAEPPEVGDARVAIVSTAGLHRRGDSTFALGAADYRLIPGDLDAADLIMSHVSVNFDRSGFQQDMNVVFPLTRLQELASAGEIGSVAAWHYSFMGATDPTAMEEMARKAAALLREDRVTCALLVPV